MRNTLIKWLVIILLFGYIVAISIWANARAAQAKCTGVEVCIDRVDGILADSITSNGIIAELNSIYKGFTGKALSQINTRKIEQHLTALSNLEKVECVVTSGGKLRIIVQPMIPALRIFDGQDSYYINRAGKRIEANARFFTEVPIVTGHFTNNFSPTYILPVADFISSDSLWKNLIVMIKADSPNNIMLVPRIRGHIINLGDNKNLSTKFRNLLLAYQEIIPYRGWETFDTISVKFRDRIVATRSNKQLISHTPVYEENIDYEEDAAASSVAADQTPSNDPTRTNLAPEPPQTATPAKPVTPTASPTQNGTQNGTQNNQPVAPPGAPPATQKAPTKPAQQTKKSN